MNWRTDKPTADIIVVFLKGSCYPQVLEYDKEKQCYLEEHNSPVDIQDIEKWADLEEEEKQAPITEVMGFKVGDAVRLKDGDGRKHIIKSFEEVGGLHGPNFYRVEFEDDTAGDHIFPNKQNPTQMVKIKDETETDCHEIEKELERFYLDVLCADSIIQQKATEIPNSIRYHNFPIMWEDLIDIARHFAKWGAEHLKK